MSKERLELARELLDSFKSNREIHEPFVMSFEYETIEALEYIIEQAERTQELEELVNEVNEKDFNLVVKLQQQNKRYREAIIETLHGLKTLPSVAPRLYLISILDKALEESE